MRSSRFFSLRGFPLFFIIFINSMKAEPTFTRFETTLGKKVKEEFVYLKAPSSTAIRCACYCENNQSCNAASYNRESGICDLSANKVDEAENDERLVNESSWMVLSKKTCLQGWTEIGDTCYYFVKDEKNFTEAKKYCEKIGGKLAEPQTNTTFEQLQTYLVKNQDVFFAWIGLYNVDDNEKFVWLSDGAAPVYTAWAFSFSVIYDGCVFVDIFYRYKWNPVPCFYYTRAICEIRINGAEHEKSNHKDD